MAPRLQTATDLASVLADNYIGGRPALLSLFLRQPHIHAAHLVCLAAIILYAAYLQPDMQFIVMQDRRALGDGQASREAANERTALTSSKRPGRGDTLHDR